MDNPFSPSPKDSPPLTRPDGAAPSPDLIRRPAYGSYGGYGYGYAAANSQVNNNAQSGGLLEYWRILRHQKGTWLIYTFIGAVIGLLATIPQTPIYQAKASVEIQSLNENFMNLRQNTEVYEAGTDPSEIPTQINVIQSRAVLGAVVKQFKDSKRPIAIHSRVEFLRRFLPGRPSAASSLNQELADIAKSFKARAVGQTRVISITADSSDPALAADFINAVNAKLIEQNLESRWKSTQKTAEWLGHQLDDMRVKLERSEDSLQQYARQSGLLFTNDEKTNVSEDKLKQLQQELSAAAAARIARQSTYELAQHASPDALPDVLNDASLRDTANRIRDLRSQIADLRAVYAPEYDKVRRAQAEIVALQATFEHDRNAILSRIKNEFDDSARREELLQKAYDAQTQEVTGQGEKSIQYNILKREVDSNRQLYDAMLAQLKQSSIASAMRASNIHVVDDAIPPASPYKPDRKQSAGIGALVGVFLGGAFIVMRFRADTSIQQPGESMHILGVPELAIIPAGKHENSNRSSPQVKTYRKSSNSKPGSANLPPSPKVSVPPSSPSSSRPNTTSTPRFKPSSSPAPAPAKANPPSPATWPSPSPKSAARSSSSMPTCAAPANTSVFSVNNDFGLSTVLNEKVALNGDPTLGGAIQETPIPDLWILPSGPSTSSSTNLLINPHMSRLLKHLKKQFDIILIDTPPMLQIPDARVVGRLADSVIMVIRANKTTRGAVMAACQRFSEDGTKILGTILNDWNPKTAPDGYYGYYNYRTPTTTAPTQNEVPGSVHRFRCSSVAIFS